MTTLTTMSPTGAAASRRVGQDRDSGLAHGWEFSNVGPAERITLAVAGGVLTVGSLLKRRPSVLLSLLGGGLLTRALTGYCPLYHALGIDHAHLGEAKAEDFFKRGIHVESVRVIQKLPEELYRFWRNFENLPRFMDNLEAVRCFDGTRSHWKAKAPAGTSVEWDAQIINEEENRLIAWRSLEGADVDSAGSVRFVPTPRGTEVRVVLDYIPPAGAVGAAVAKLFGREPQQQVDADLRRFQQLMETGEVSTTDGQPRGTCGK